MKNEVLLPEQVRTYLEEHKLQEAVTSALNGLLKSLPSDPYGVLAEEFAKRANSPPQLVGFRRQDPWQDEQLKFFVVVNIRGFPVRVHTMTLSNTLFGKPEPPKADEGEEEAKEAEDPEAESVDGKIGEFIVEFGSHALEGQSVDAFLTLHERCNQLAEFEYGCDLPALTAMLSDHLLQASANAMNKSPLGFLQYLLTLRAHPPPPNPDGTQPPPLSLREIHEQVRASPPLQAPEDFAVWHTRWPSFTFPIFYGGAPGGCVPSKLRFCVALSPFATVPGQEATPATEGAPEECPRLGFFKSVASVGARVNEEAGKLYQADKALAGLVVDGVNFSHSGGLKETAGFLRKAVEAAVEKQDEASGVLIAGADEAWIAEELVYEIESGKKLNLEELVDLYADLCEDGWIKTIVQPFRLDDFSEGSILLKSKCPDIHISADYGSEPPTSLPKGDSAYGYAPSFTGLSAPAALRQYIDRVKGWPQDSIQFVNLPETSGECPSLVEVALACSDTKQILIPKEITEEGLMKINERLDDMLWRAVFPCEDDA